MWCIGEFSDQINDPLNVSDLSKDDGQDDQELEFKLTEKSSTLQFDPLSPDLSDLLVDISNPISSGLDSPVDLGESFNEKSDDEYGVGDNSVSRTGGQDRHSLEDSLSKTIKEIDLIERCQDILDDPRVNTATKEYALSALFKLSARFPNLTAQVKVYVDGRTTDSNLELQQRSIEFSTIFSRHEHILASVFERMPPIERPAKEELDES